GVDEIAVERHARAVIQVRTRDTAVDVETGAREGLGILFGEAAIGVDALVGDVAIEIGRAIDGECEGGADARVEAIGPGDHDAAGAHAEMIDGWSDLTGAEIAGPRGVGELPAGADDELIGFVETQAGGVDETGRDIAAYRTHGAADGLLACGSAGCRPAVAEGIFGELCSGMHP